MSSTMRQASARGIRSPFQPSRVAPVSRVRSVVVRAEESSAASTSEAPAMKFNHAKIPQLKWEQDGESIREVFAFAGPAPERCNGRVAMIAFTSLALTEVSKHTPALEQFGNAWFGVIFFSLTITFATIAPKLVSGSPLKDLHAVATSENLKSEGAGAFLALFDQSLELWAGRGAMIGVAGLIAAEVLKGDALF